MPQSITTEKPFTSQPAWLTVLRVALGIIIIWKGINFIRDTSELKSMIEQTGVGIFSSSSGAFALVVSMLSLLCGFLIAVGLFTRLASIVMIPIILVSIIFVQIKNIEGNTFELILTIVVLILLTLFALKGSGLLSADAYFGRGAVRDRKS